MARYEKVRAVILGSRMLGEADRIVSLFTKELGLADAVVRGVRRPSSRWGGRLEPFNVCDLVLYRGRSLFTVTQAQTLEVFRRLREDRQAIAAAAVICEAAAGLFPHNEPEPRVYELLVEALRQLDAGFEGGALRAPLVLGGLLKLLDEAGYQPVLDSCASCGGDGQTLAFSSACGGLVCGTCLCDLDLPITPDAIAALEDALTLSLGESRRRPPADAVEEALRDAHSLFAYHTGSRLRSVSFARVVR